MKMRNFSATFGPKNFALAFVQFMKQPLKGETLAVVVFLECKMS